MQCNAGDHLETPGGLYRGPPSMFIQSIYIIQFLHADSISLTPPRARHPTLRKLL